MLYKRWFYIEAAAVVVVLLLALAIALPRFEDSQLDARVTARIAELQEVVDELIAEDIAALRVQPEQSYYREPGGIQKLQVIASPHNLQGDMSYVGGMYNVETFVTRGAASPAVALRVARSRYSDRILWAMAAPVPRSTDEPFEYRFPGMDVKTYMTTKSDRQDTRGVGHGVDYLLRDAFDVSNGLTSDGVLLVWSIQSLKPPIDTQE